ncbi:DUF1963 domain-containing protein [Plantactinospora endophytica]|uniref:DUF1963 domain-containing protein n=1 Tax=Plantactinospora endophytica TaxID=673535 RepID=A0ABQ4DSS7_9ACTN|nr:DUF1963 domain-containing protein [Plantactinospora endophytica]GIG85503.1 hypothetical protein Pen02_04390 [Plantactinospora endophytica]
MDFHRAMAALRTALADSSRAQAAPDLVEQVLDLVRPSIGLAVPARSRNGAATDSVAGWYGGLPGLPDGVPWPEHRGRPMTLLAQLDCAALAPLLGPEWTLPRDGVLLFFSEEWFHADFGTGPGDDGCAVLHVPAGAPRRDAPAGTGVVPALPLVAAPVLAAPDYTEPELAALFSADPIRVMGLATEIRDRLPTVRHRVLGWLDSQLAGPAGHRPLLALEAEEGTAWGELVGVSFWIGGPDLTAGRFSRVRRVLEVA